VLLPGEEYFHHRRARPFFNLKLFPPAPIIAALVLPSAGKASSAWKPVRGFYLFTLF